MLSLDTIRVLATISIMMYHYTQRYEEIIGHVGVYPFMWKYGAMAVDIFFMLSGFLAIYHLKHNCFIYSLKRRAVRLYPAYWCCMILTAIVVHFWLPEKSIGILSWCINLSMLQDMIGVKSVDGAYWTLLYELIFYAVIAVVQTQRKPHKVLDKVFLLWIALAYFMCLISSLTTHNEIDLVVKIANKLLILDKAYAFIVGGSFALLMLRKMTCTNMLAALMAMAYPIVVGNAASSILLVVVCLSLSLLLVYESQNQVACKAISYLAAVSYPFYLLHQYIGFAIIKEIERIGFTSELYLFVPIGIVLAMAIFVHEIVEVKIGGKIREYIL